jgi:phosphate transport system permease protein
VTTTVSPAASDRAADLAADLAAITQTRRRPGEAIVKGLLASCAAVSVLTTIGIVVSLLRPAIQFFSKVSLWKYLTGKEWSPLIEPASYGIRPLLVGTLVITVIAIAVAIPLGLGAAIYLSEYASARSKRILKPMLELLAGIPTVVYGFFALTFVTPSVLQKFWFIGAEPDIFNALSAGLVMGIMILPTMASLAEDSLAAVPAQLRAGSLALGANRFQTTVKVIVPAALSGLVAASVLAVSRAVGETMIVTIAAGGQPNLTLDARQGMQTMTSFIAATGQGDLPQGSNQYRTIFAVGITLFVLTLLLNLFSSRMVRRFREVYE